MVVRRATCDPDRKDLQALSEEVASLQLLAGWLFHSGFARYKPFVIVCGDALGDESTTVVNKTVKRVNHAVSTIPIEGQSEDDLRQVVDRVKANVKAEIEAH